MSDACKQGREELVAFLCFLLLSLLDLEWLTAAEKWKEKKQTTSHLCLACLYTAAKPARADR